MHPESLEMEELVVHPHDPEAERPERLPAAVLRELSVLEPGRALMAVAMEWLGIALAVALFVWSPYRWWFYLPVLLFVGARQHALTVIGHDASHYRFLPSRFWNDALGNLLLQWPVFISVEGFRKFHGTHHRFLAGEKDGNRFLWKTHTPQGELAPEWKYPKNTGQLVLKILRRAFFFTGLRWILRGLIGMFVVRSSWLSTFLRLLFYGALAALFTSQGWWMWFVWLWLVPFCTWHIATQYMRLIAEHSAIESEDPAFAETRTTIPTWWESLLILPRNIGYHIEHHWFPSVPFYKLPALHAALMQSPRFQKYANISRSILSSMALVTHSPRPSVDR